MKSEILKTIPKGFYNKLGIGIISLCLGATIAISRSNNLSFSSGETSLQIDSQKIKTISNDAEHAIDALTTKVHHLENDIQWLKAEFDDPMFQKALELIDQTIQREIEPTIRVIEEKSNDLKDVTKEVSQQE